MNTKQLIATLALAFVASAHAATPITQGSQPVPAASAVQPDDAKIEQQTKAMQDMHEKIMAAKTPEARAALMQEGMTSMQSGMTMMGHMRRGMGAGMGSHMGGMGMSNGMQMDCTNLDKHMDMMDAMMQLMTDLQAPAKQ
ncbi:hypothetical protein ACQKFS_03690 [Pseudomonas guineae]|uniref:hypothetical protein n=1 Tax=Pseudomonas guineae TaxID=425504 RepID=UPI0030EE53E3